MFCYFRLPTKRGLFFFRSVARRHDLLRTSSYGTNANAVVNVVVGGVLVVFDADGTVS